MHIFKKKYTVNVFYPFKRHLMLNLCKTKNSIFIYLALIFLNISSVTLIQASDWSIPVNLSSCGVNSTNATVTFDSTGLVMTAWSEFNGNHYVICSSSKELIGSWGEPIQISIDGADAFSPQVVLDDHGNAFAIWVRKNKDNFVIQSATKLFGTSWELPIDISRCGLQGEDASLPQIILNPCGGFYAIWQKNNGKTNVIEFASWDLKLKKWSAIKTLSSNKASGLGCTNPRIASNRFGDVFAVWCNNEKRVVQGALGRRNATRWTTPKALSEFGNQVTNAEIAIDFRGNAIAVWSSRIGIDYVVQAATRQKGYKWQAPVNLSADGECSIQPSLSMNFEGTAIVSWQKSDGVYSIIQLATKVSGSNWSSPINLSTEGDDATDSQAVISSSNKIFVAWKRSNGANFVIQTSTKEFESVFSDPLTISEEGHDAVNPQIAIDKLGNTVAVWRRSDGINTITEASFKSALP